MEYYRLLSAFSQLPDLKSIMLVPLLLHMTPHNNAKHQGRKSRFVGSINTIVNLKKLTMYIASARSSQPEIAS